MEPDRNDPSPPRTHDELAQILAEVLRKEGPALRQIAATHGPEGDPANGPTDIVHSAVADVLRKEGEKESPAVRNPRGLLFTVVRNKAIDRRRRHRTRRKRLGKAVPLDVADPGGHGALGRESGAGPQEQLIQNELDAEMRALEQKQRELVETWLRELSRDQRLAIVLHRNGLSVAEIAEHMRRSPKAVRLLIDRGRAALRRRASLPGPVA